MNDDDRAKRALERAVITAIALLAVIVVLLAWPK
jgi:hypothetical protein